MKTKPLLLPRPLSMLMGPEGLAPSRPKTRNFLIEDASASCYTTSTDAGGLTCRDIVTQTNN